MIEKQNLLMSHTLILETHRKIVLAKLVVAVLAFSTS